MIRVLVPSLLLACACGTLSPSFAQAEDPAGTIRKAGAHFELVCHFDDARIAGLALEAVEAAWEPCATLLDPKNKTKAAALKYEVHLYRTSEDYEAVEAKLTKGKFRTNLGFSHHASQSSHVALQPPCSDATLAQVGLPELTRRVLIHEAAHLVVYQLVPANFEDHPFWLEEGLTTWVEEATCLEQGWIGEVRGDPYFSDRRFRVRSLARAEQLDLLATV